MADLTDMSTLTDYQIPADEQPKPRPAPRRFTSSRRRSQCRQARNDGRTLRFTPATPERLAMLTITVRRGSKVEESRYVLTEVGSDIGRGFVLGRLGAEDVYTTHVGGQGLCSCTCDGFAHGWSCRHVEALVKVIELGLIPGGTP
jgi:hypothetical protein